MKKIILDEKYEIGLSLGCWAKSKETKTIVKGDCRVIGKIIMSAYEVDHCAWFRLFGDLRDTVWWAPADDSYNTMENLRKFTETC